MSFDQVTAGHAFKGRPEQWISYATVDPETADAPSVRFKDEAGNPLPYGPMVNVTLQPSGVSVPARCGFQVAGQQEGEWYPFVAGDELLVALPEGNERAGAVIISRLNQEIDRWPAIVAGQDSTKNTFGFRRMRTPFVVETAAAYLIRSAVTGSQIGIDSQGQVVINDGEQGTLAIGAEALGLTSGDGATFVNVFPPSKEVFLGADTATFLLSASASKFISQGSISFATQGGIPNQTAVTLEQVVALIINVLTAFGPTAFPVGVLAAPTAAIIGPIMTAAIAALGTPAIPADAVPGGVFATYPTVFGPTGAIALMLQNPIANAVAAIDVTGFVPGLGRPGFKL